MGRELTSPTQTALSSGDFAPFYALELNFYNGLADQAAPLYLWSGLGDLNLGGRTYMGVGDLLSIGDIEEASELKASGVTLQLSGIAPSTLTSVLEYEYSGRTAKIYMGMMGETALNEIFSGFMDVMTILDTPESSVISITVENRLIDLERVNPFRYTQESHALLYQGDTFFSFVSDLQDQQIEWGPNAGNSVAAIAPPAS